MLALLLPLFLLLFYYQHHTFHPQGSGRQPQTGKRTSKIKGGTVIGLLGPSGAGKTTLVNLLTDQLTPFSGTICREQNNLASLPISMC